MGITKTQLANAIGKLKIFIEDNDYDITELTTDDIQNMIGLSSDEIETLASIIIDDEVRLDKTWSSSKIYTDIQECKKDCNSYTLNQLGNYVCGSFKVVANTSDITDTKYIYLLPNNDVYDLYIYDSETDRPINIGNTTITLTDYYTKTEVADEFLTKSDAIITYATVESVSDISTNAIRKTNLITSLDSESTDEQIASAKTVYDITKDVVHNPVSDVVKTDVTPILMDAEVVSGGSINYSVKNGICYLNIIGVVSETNSMILPSSTLPLPNTNITASNYPVCDKLGGAGIAVIGDNGSLTIYGEFASSNPCYTTIMYPVAE